MGWAEAGLFAIAFVLVAVGIVGTVLPAMPGPVAVFAGLVIAAWAEDFAYVGGYMMALLGGLTALTFGVDFAATALGAKKLGASRRAAIGAALGTLAGLFFGLPGVILGPFVGAVIAELTAHRDIERAGRAGLGAWLGLVVGTGAKLAIIGTMIGVFALARFG
jgi:hypothetical protein